MKRLFKHKYLDILLQDGFQETESLAVLEEISDKAGKMLSKYKNQEELESKIIDSVESIPDKITPSLPVRLLPGIIELAPYHIDVGKLMVKVFSHDGSWERTKPAMRFLDLWHDKVTAKERAYIIRRSMETDESIAAHPLALYSEKTTKKFSDDPHLINDIFHFITKHHQILAVLSALPLAEIPASFRAEFAKWIPFRETLMKTDSVIPVRHVNNFAGTCAWMTSAHYETFIGRGFEPETYGDVTLIYINQKLIGSMKMDRDRSIIGVKNILDSKGRLTMVIGGVYTTTSEITIQAEQSFKKQGKFAKLYLEEISLFPMEFVASEDGPDMIRWYAKLINQRVSSIEETLPASFQ